MPVIMNLEHKINLEDELNHFLIMYEEACLQSYADEYNNEDMYEDAYFQSYANECNDVDEFDYTSDSVIDEDENSHYINEYVHDYGDDGWHEGIMYYDEDGSNPFHELDEDDREPYVYDVYEDDGYSFDDAYYFGGFDDFEEEDDYYCNDCYYY